MTSTQIFRRIPFGGFFRLVLLGGVFASSINGQNATDVSAFGPATTDPVVISGSWTLSCSSTTSFDFGPREVVFAPGAVVSTGGCTLTAARFVVQAGATIGHGGVVLHTNHLGSPHDGAVIIAGGLDASGNFVTDGLPIRVVASGTLTVQGTGVVRATAGTDVFPSGGDILLQSSGDLLIDAGAPIDSSSPSPGGSGGDMTVRSTAGSVDLRRPILTGAQAFSGSATLIAQLDLTVSGAVDTSADPVFGFDPGAAGRIIATATSGAMNVSAPLTANGGGPFGLGHSINLSAAGDIDVTASLTSIGFAFSFGGGPRAISLNSDGACTMTGAVNGHGLDNIFGTRGGRGATFSVQSSTSVTISGSIDVRGGSGSEGYGLGGSVSVQSAGPISVGSVTTDGWPAGPVTIQSGETLQTGTITADSIYDPSGSGGSINLNSGRDALLGFISVRGSVQPGTIVLHAARDLSSDGADASTVLPLTAAPLSYFTATAGRVLETAGPITYSGVAGTPTVDSVRMTACRIRVHGPIGSDLPGLAGGRIQFTAYDRFTTDSAIGAAPNGTVRLTTRLPDPFSPVYETGAVVTPPLDVTHDPALAPCLAIGRASLSAPASVTAGGGYELVLNGRPNRGVLVAVGLHTAQSSLGALGYTQTDLLSALLLADPGLLGPALPGSTTDGDGRWSFATTVPLLAVGFQIHAEAFVFADSAINGFFDQPPAATTSINVPSL